MKTSNGNVETRRQNIIRIFQYILKQKKVSRQEIAVALGYSLPTVIQNVHDLIEWGGICESGVYDSTGGRKARVLQVKEGFRFVVGADISSEYVDLVLIDLSYKLVDTKREYLPYENTNSYYRSLDKKIQNFVDKNQKIMDKPEKLIGIGFSLPGIIDHNLGALSQSRELDISHVNIRSFSQFLPYEFCFENKANCAMYSLLGDNQMNALYLSLDEIVEGSIFINDRNYPGDNFRAGQLGHMILVPGGRKCFCGKEGCVNAYISSSVLLDENIRTLEQFFLILRQGDTSAWRKWEEYLDYLALTISNMRTAYDCDIILGGSISSYLEDDISILKEKIRNYDNMDDNFNYLSICTSQTYICACGAAKYMIDNYIADIDILNEM